MPPDTRDRRGGIKRILLGHVSVQHGNDSSTCEVSLLLVAILGPRAGRMIKYWQAVAVQLLVVTGSFAAGGALATCGCFL